MNFPALNLKYPDFNIKFPVAWLNLREILYQSILEGNDQSIYFQREMHYLSIYKRKVEIDVSEFKKTHHLLCITK